MDRELQLELTHYFESANDGSAQENFLRELANEEVQRGICLHLVLTWMLLYKRANNTKAPNIIWNEIERTELISSPSCAFGVVVECWIWKRWSVELLCCFFIFLTPCVEQFFYAGCFIIASHLKRYAGMWIAVCSLLLRRNRWMFA